MYMCGYSLKAAQDHVQGIKSIITEIINEVSPEDIERSDHLRELAIALMDLWEAFESLTISSSDFSDKPTVSFFINYILTRYVYGISMAAVLCRFETVDMLARTLLEYYEKAFLLDTHLEYRNLDPVKRINWLTGHTSKNNYNDIITFSRTYYEKLKEIIPDRLKRILSEVYWGLSSTVHGTSIWNAIKLDSSKALVPMSCKKSILDANHITQTLNSLTLSIKEITKIVKET